MNLARELLCQPNGRWSLHVDGPMLEIDCPRYWGDAAVESSFTSIELDWTGPNSARMTVDEPALQWTFNMVQEPLFIMVNAINTALPLASWRSRALVAAREWVAEYVVDVGPVDLSGPLPGGMFGILMPKRIYRIHDSTAKLDGVDLGDPVHLEEPPRFGEFRLPSCPLLSETRDLGGTCGQELPHLVSRLENGASMKISLLNSVLKSRHFGGGSPSGRRSRTHMYVRRE